jgi:hypothetical protein
MQACSDHITRNNNAKGIHDRGVSYQSHMFDGGGFTGFGFDSRKRDSDQDETRLATIFHSNHSHNPIIIAKRVSVST